MELYLPCLFLQSPWQSHLWLAYKYQNGFCWDKDILLGKVIKTVFFKPGKYPCSQCIIIQVSKIRYYVDFVLASLIIRSFITLDKTIAIFLSLNFVRNYCFISDKTSVFSIFVRNYCLFSNKYTAFLSKCRRFVHSWDIPLYSISSFKISPGWAEYAGVRLYWQSFWDQSLV